MTATTNPKKPSKTVKVAKAAPAKRIGRPPKDPSEVKIKRSVAVLRSTYDFLAKLGNEDGKPNVSQGIEIAVSQLRQAQSTVRQLRSRLKKAGLPTTT